MFECRTVLAAIQKLKQRTRFAVQSQRYDKSEIPTKNAYSITRSARINLFFPEFNSYRIMIFELATKQTGSVTRCVTLVEWGRHR